MWPILASIIPLVVVIGIGVLLRHYEFLDADSTRRLNRLLFWVLLPSFLVHQLATSEILRGASTFPWAATMAACLAIAITMLVLFIAGRGLAPERLGSLFSVAFRSNGAFVGLPLAALLADNGVIDSADVERYLLLLVILVPVFNVVSVAGFILPHHGLRLGALKPTVRNLATNPLILSCLLGMVLGLLPPAWDGYWRDGVLMHSLDLLGEPALGLALLGAGASLSFANVRAITLDSWFAAGWKLLGMPALALALAWLIGVGQGDQVILAIIAMCPTAVATVPMAAALRGDVALAATGVVLSTVLSPITMVLWLALWLH